MNIYRLTRRELEVLRRLSLGRHVYQVAEDMGVQKETVRRHCTNAMAKLQVHTKAHALYVCGKEGLV